MTGEQDLDRLLAGMVPRLADGVYVFASLPDRSVPQGVTPLMTFEEVEGTTLILSLKEAEDRALAFDFRARMITLDVHSALAAVGFMARIAAELTAHGISVNPVAGFYHDHLFVPEARAAEAVRVLQELSAASR